MHIHACLGKGNKYKVHLTMPSAAKLWWSVCLIISTMRLPILSALQLVSKMFGTKEETNPPWLP